MVISKNNEGDEERKRRNPLEKLNFQAKNYQIPEIDHKGLHFTVTQKDAKRSQLLAVQLQEVIEQLFLDDKINPAMDGTVLCVVGLKTDYSPIELELSFESLLKAIWLLRKIRGARGLQTDEQRGETGLLLKEAFYFYGLFTQMAMSNQSPALRILASHLAQYSNSPVIIGGLFSLRIKVLRALDQQIDKAIVLLKCLERDSLSDLLSHAGVFFEFLLRKDADFLIEFFVGNPRLTEEVISRRSGTVEYFLNNPRFLKVLMQLDGDLLDCLFTHNDDVLCEFVRFQEKELKDFFAPHRKNITKRVLSSSPEEILQYLQMLHDSNIQHFKVDLHKMLIELESIEMKRFSEETF